MEKIAFIYGNTFIYWNSVVLTLAAGVAICLFLAFYLRDGKKLAAAVAVPLALVLSVFFGRLFHWYFRPDSYTGFIKAMTDYTTGGYALMGCFAACGATAGILKLLGLEKHPARMLDAMSLAGSGAIALGRLACFTNSADRGGILPEGTVFGGSVVSAATGTVEYRLNTFLLQSAAAGVIFLILLVLYFARRREYHRRPGDLFWLFCLYYGGSQAVLDSTRTDSIFFQFNGFVGVVQVLGLCAVVLTLVCFTVRYLKTGGKKLGAAALWAVCLLFLGGAVYMEYYVQRHGTQALFAYSAMSICMGVTLILGTVLWSATRSREIPRSMPTVYESMVQGDFR